MATITFHCGSAVRQAHNLRTPACLAKEKHIDPKGIHETWHHENLVDAYHRIFDPAVKEYNQKQRRKDRQIKSYYGKIQQDSKHHVCYEAIIGVYGTEVSDEVGKWILKDFVDGWNDRNPNMELIGAYYHADEQGQPHVHLDYIPVGEGYCRGLEKQVSMIRALENQGFKSIDGRNTAQVQWYDRERKALEDLCNDYGLFITHPDAGTGRVHENTAAYRLNRDMEALRAQNEALRAQNEALRAQNKVEQKKSHKAKQELNTERFVKAMFHAKIEQLGGELEYYVEESEVYDIMNSWEDILADLKSDYPAEVEQFRKFLRSEDEQQQDQDEILVESEDELER